MKKISLICGVCCILNVTLNNIGYAEDAQYDCKTENQKEYCLDADKKPMTGKIKKYQEDGSYQSIVNYKNGYPDGLATYFAKEGKLKERVYYKQGIKNGMDKIYYENRTIHQLLNYRDGVLDGQQEFYTPEGKILGRADYNRGILKTGFCLKNEGGRLKKHNFDAQTIKNNAYNNLITCEAL